MTTRATRPAPAVGDTQSMPIVEVPVQRLAYTPDVLKLFNDKIDDAVTSVEVWGTQQHEAINTTAQQRHDQIDAHVKDRIAQLRQALADIEASAHAADDAGHAGGHPYEETDGSEGTQGGAS